MINFLRLIEIVKTRGVVGADKNGGVVRFPPNKCSFAFDAIEKCHPFVFSPKNETPTELKGEDLPIVFGPDIRHDIDSPFEVFSVEILGQHICVPRPDDEVKCWMNCVVVQEIKPKEYGYLVLIIDEEGNEEVFASNREYEIIKEFLDRLKKEKTGVESVRQRVKIGSGKTKKIHTIRQIVHVAPNKSPYIQSTNERKVNWTHKWEVRGHWREHIGLGKDRSGIYCVNGHTWVKEHEKGEGILIKKTRVVE